MPSAIIADSIVNLCGAIGLSIAIITLDQRDRNSPLTRRLVLALGAVTLLFFMRGAAWWAGSALLDRLSLLPAAAIPLCALIVTEGILRRHAPRALKIAIASGSLALGFGGIFELVSFTAPYSLLLAFFQVSGFACCAWLLITRDRASLTASENRSIGRLAVGSLIAIPFIATDFRAITPDIPVRLGALGALLIISVVLIAGGGAETRRQGLQLMALRLVSAALLGAAAAFLAPDVDAAQIMRFCAVAIAGVLTIGLMVDTVRALFESQAPGLLNSVAASGARTRAELMAELARHPIFESAHRYREAELEAYDPPILRGVLAKARVLRRFEAPWGLAAIDPAAERAVSLMTSINATHLIVLSQYPIDVVAVAVPVISADPATETALALVGRLLAAAPETA